ncbi:MAG: preprotein translocase subunit SecY [bacterium]|nr:preprotein translocase subunit SecY [bacterium]
MLASLLSAFKIPELRKRIIFVFGMIGIFILGLHIAVPGIDKEAMEKLFSGGGLLGLLDVFSGGALRKFSIFAMGIAPYINASIIMQLLTIAVPSLEEMSKEGESGRKKITQYTRYLTIVLALFQGGGICLWLAKSGILTVSSVTFPMIVITLAAGTAFLMWLGEQVTEKGIGNGISLLIFTGILARMPTDVAQVVEQARVGAVNLFDILLFLAIFIAMVLGIIFIQQGQRRIPVQYAKRVVGRRMYGGQSTFIPLKVNQSGVIPIIFAVSVLLFPATIAQFAPQTGTLGSVMAWVKDIFAPGSFWYSTFYVIMVVLFTFFYTAVIFNPVEVADNMKKYGGFVPGIRPGRPTAEYLNKILTRITMAGAVFLAFIAVVPTYLMNLTDIQIYYMYGGTSLLIMVGVALETMQQIEAHLLMRNYEGFIK